MRLSTEERERKERQQKYKERGRLIFEKKMKNDICRIDPRLLCWSSSIENFEAVNDVIKNPHFMGSK